MCLLLALVCAAAVGHCPVFMLALGLNLQFVCTIWSHEPELVCPVHQLEVILLQTKEEFHHTAGLNLIKQVF